MRYRVRTPRPRGHRPRNRRRDLDRALRAEPFLQLSADELMLDLDPDWVRARMRGGAS